MSWNFEMEGRNGSGNVLSGPPRGILRNGQPQRKRNKWSALSDPAASSSKKATKHFSRGSQPVDDGYERLDKESSFVVADQILRMQVDFLISSAGAPQHLRTIVKSIWFSYLSVAMPDISNGVQTTVRQNQRWLGILRENDFSHLLDTPSNQVQFILKLWTSEQEKTIDYAVDTTSLKRPRTFRSTHKTPDLIIAASTLFEAPERFILPCLIAILVLALKFCHQDILTSDLIRWIRALQLPYLDPELSPRSYDIFKIMLGHHTGIVPTYHKLEWHLMLLCKVIEIDSISFPPISAVPVIERFLTELNLPDAILPMTVSLAERLNQLEFEVQSKRGGRTTSRRRAMNVEAFVMSLIMCVLRTLFGLDGVAEQTIAKNTRKLRKLIGEDVGQLFEFEEWVNYISARRLHLFRHTVLLHESHSVPLLALMKRNLSSADPVGKDTDDAEEACQRLQTEFSKKLLALRRSRTDDLISLPPTYRPFRAHSEALGAKYLLLIKDFGDHDMLHLMSPNEIPRKWDIRSESVVKVEKCLGRIQRAQNILNSDAFPLRAHSHRVGTENYLQDVTSESMKWLIRIGAELIEQSPESLLGQLYFLEICLFSRNQKQCLAFSWSISKGHIHVQDVSAEIQQLVQRVRTARDRNRHSVSWVHSRAHSL